MLHRAFDVTFTGSIITANKGFLASVGKQQPRVPK